MTAKRQTVETPHDEVEPISLEEGWEILDKQAREHLKMSAEEFLAAWKAGKFAGKEEDPDVLHLAMLLPLVDEGEAGEAAT
jgi:hypothetical protein